MIIMKSEAYKQVRKLIKDSELTFSQFDMILGLTKRLKPNMQIPILSEEEICMLEKEFPDNKQA